MSVPRLVMDEVLCHFAELEDRRSEVNRKHPLPRVIVIVLLAILAHASGPTGVVLWAETHADFLQSLIPLPIGIPRKDVFRRVLCALKPEAFQACFMEWLDALRTFAATETGGERPVYAVDGRTLRRSHDQKHGLAAWHCVSVWASQYGIIPAQVATDQKSNAITAIPQALQLVDLTGAIVDGGGDSILGLKGNQEKLCAAVIDDVMTLLETDFAQVPVRQLVTESNGHGRQETRQFIQLSAPKTLPCFSEWIGLPTIGVVILNGLRKGVTTTEVRYSISSLPPGIQQFATAVRSDWGMENTCHGSLDFTCREDESRTREKNARENMAWLDRFTLSLLKQHPGKPSLTMKRRI